MLSALNVGRLPAVLLGWVDPKTAPYNAPHNGTTDARAALAAADAAAVAAGLPLRLAAGDFRIASNLTLSAHVIMLPGASLVPDPGVTVQLSHPPTIGAWRAFYPGAGAAIEMLEAGAVYAEWWGAATGGATSCTSAIQAALQACRRGGWVQLLEGRYLIDGTLTAPKYPGNSGAWGVFNLRGVGCSGVDDLYMSENYGTTLWVPNPLSATPVIDLAVSRGALIQDLNIVGCFVPVVGSKAIGSTTAASGTKLNRVALWGWEHGLDIGGAANNDDWTLHECNLQRLTTAVYNSGVESYQIRLRDCTVGYCGVLFHTVGNATGGVMNSFVVDGGLIGCTDCLVRYSSPLAAHHGGSIIRIRDADIEAPSGPLRVFDCESLYAFNPLGLEITGCTIGAGIVADPFDPAFRHIRYYGRGPFIFTGNIVGGSRRFVVEIVSDASTLNTAAMEWSRNVFGGTTPVFITPRGEPFPALCQQGNVCIGLPAQKFTDAFEYAERIEPPDLIVDGRRINGRAPLAPSTWLQGSTYFDTASSTMKVCTVSGTLGTIAGCTATLNSGDDYATYVAGAAVERRKIHAGMFITIGAATPLEVQDVLNDIIYLRTAWAGATQTAAAVAHAAPTFV